MPRHRAVPLLVALGLLAALPTASPAAAAQTPRPLPVTSVDGVEVTTYGAVQITSFGLASNPSATIAVHAVQRVPGATIAYLSVGASPASTGVTFYSLGELFSRFSLGFRYTNVRIADTTAGMLFDTVTYPDDAPGALPFASLLQVYPSEPGAMGVFYAVLQELPTTTTTVDVTVGRGATIADVPVGDGYLEPALDPDAVIQLGTGWPRIDPAQIAKITDAAESTYPLTAVIEALDGSKVNRETADQVTIDIAGDVLFDFDSSTLSAQAQSTLDGIVTEVAARAAPGTLSVIGHTDSDADDAYNDALSQRRAQAVADVLGPRLSGQGLNLVVEGRGEREPVADNGTAEGRAANRRVSVTFTLADQGTP